MTSNPSLDPRTAVTVGRIVAAHGVRGEVKVEPLSDFPERFAAGSVLWLDGAPQTVERGRRQRRSVILKLIGVDTRNEAEALAGKTLQVPEAAEIAVKGVYYLHDVIGAGVETAAGESLGELADVFSTGSNDVYVVRGPRGELLLPALDDVVLEVDLTGRKIVVDVPEGLEFTAPARQRRRPTPRKAKTAD